MGKVKDKQIESISLNKIINLENKNFVSNEILEIINRFSSDEKGVLLYDGTAIGQVPKLNEINSTFKLCPFEVKKIAIPAGFLKYDIRTIHYTSTNFIKIDIYDNLDNGFLLYSTSAYGWKYEIVNVPCEDKSGKKNINLIVSNKGALPVAGNINIKITSLA